MPKLIAQEELRVLICDQFIRDTAICESVGSCLIQFVENFQSLVSKSWKVEYFNIMKDIDLSMWSLEKFCVDGRKFRRKP